MGTSISISSLFSLPFSLSVMHSTAPAVCKHMHRLQGWGKTQQPRASSGELAARFARSHPVLGGWMDGWCCSLNADAAFHSACSKSISWCLFSWRSPTHGRRATTRQRGARFLFSPRTSVGLSLVGTMMSPAVPSAWVCPASSPPGYPRLHQPLGKRRNK